MVCTQLTLMVSEHSKLGVICQQVEEVGPYFKDE